LDDIVVFKPLAFGDMKRIADVLLGS